MKRHHRHSWILRGLVLTFLILGILFRFTNLGYKVYWHDETFTSLRISGYTAAEVVQMIFDGDVIGLDDIQKYQRTNAEKNLIDTIRSLATEDPQHPPLYFVLARFWVQWFGNSVTAIRSLSALISVLALPCVYWLCQELFQQPAVGWAAIALFSISPFHLLFAQEAREYSLWMVTVLFASAALLRAMRLKTLMSWGLYAIALALGLYSFLFTALVAIGHGLYVVMRDRLRFRKTLGAYISASILGSFIFAPWFLVVATSARHIHEATDWSATPVGKVVLLKMWLVNITHIFIDWGFHYNADFGFNKLLSYVILAILALVIYSLYFLYSHASKSAGLFVFTLIGASALPLALPDLVSGGWRSGIPRYLIPCYLGIQLAVTYLIATKVSSAVTKGVSLRAWQLASALLVLGGMISCALFLQPQTWWSKYGDIHNPAVADIVNRGDRPLLISHQEEFGHIFSLSYLLQPKVQLRLAAEPEIPEIMNGSEDVFLFGDSQAWDASLKAVENHQSELIYKGGSHSLWQLICGKC